ncbi:MAG: GTP-binding protein related to HflX [Myxococcaceae bacterium]|nr:GTP-binding protein related to HflX [Myxococcaceae bacterium]
MTDLFVRDIDGPRPSGVLLGVQLPNVLEESFESSLRELERLAHTLGIDVVGRVKQRRASLAPAAVVGQGKLRELSLWTGGSGVVPGYVAQGKRQADEGDEPDELDEVIDPSDPAAEAEPRASIVLVDHDLTPSQMRNLEKATGAEVLDRSMVILSIFQRHARTREARMQVEIARLSYLAPRLREANVGGDRQRGGIGGKGAGETSLELDRRRIRDRIAELRRELEEVKREADTRRSRRFDNEVNTVALVGYTNAGKSSLMRALTGDEVYVADQLFATLDTTVRVLKPATRPRVLVSDTVGFIKKLPHDLVASFRSTLQEAQEASLLLHVVDGSDPAFRDQYQVTREVLAEIGAGEQPSRLVLNKADRMTDEERATLRAEFPDAIIMSARSRDDLAALHAAIVEFFERDMEEAQFLVPYEEQRKVALLHERSRVLEEIYDEDGARVRVRARKGVLEALAKEVALA